MALSLAFGILVPANVDAAPGQTSFEQRLEKSKSVFKDEEARFIRITQLGSLGLYWSIHELDVLGAGK